MSGLPALIENGDSAGAGKLPLALSGRAFENPGANSAAPQSRRTTR
jgi:hypothetical protein